MNPAADPVQRGAQADGATAHAGPVRLTGTARVEAFSDGVLAIAITLLILDIRLPSTSQDSLLAAMHLFRWDPHAPAGRRPRRSAFPP